MKKLLYIIFILLLSNELKADLVLGMHAQGDRVGFAFKKTIRVVSLKTDSVLYEKELCKDTHVVNLIYRKAKLLAIKDGKENLYLLNNIKDFTIVNITFYNNDLWIGFRYYSKKPNESSWKYGFLRLNQDYEYKSFYLIKLPAQHSFTFPPYFPIEFQNEQTILMPDIDSGKVVFRTFIVNEQQNEINQGAVYKKNIQTKSLMQVKYPESIVMDPCFYSIQGSNYEHYILFPKPIILSNSSKIDLDVFNISNQLKTSQAPRFGDGKFLLFNRYMAIDTMVLLSSLKDQDSIKFIVSSPDRERVMLFIYSIKQKQFSTRFLKLHAVDHYFIIQNKRTITLTLTDKVSKIKILNY